MSISCLVLNFFSDGELDTLVPVKQADEFFKFVKEYRLLKNQTEFKDVYVSIQEARHAFNLMSNPLTSAFSSSLIVFLRYAFSR